LPGSKDVKLNVVFNMCVVLSTGYKSYHEYTNSKQLEVVHDYEEFDSANPSNPIKLSGALRDSGDISKEISRTLYFGTKLHSQTIKPSLCYYVSLSATP
jgi:hypothetical protein